MDRHYTARLEKIEAVLRNRLPKHPDQDWVRFAFDPMASEPPTDLVRNLTEPGRELVARGGKRWRPLFMTLVCEALGGGDAAILLTPLVEFPHNGSLIHDDIEDGADERRGAPAIHITYGVDVGINSGCFMYFLPLACLDEWDAPAEKKLGVYRTYGEHLRRIHLGQAMDISWHRNFSSMPSVTEYELMCRLKTGVLARLSAVLGALIADADEQTAARIGKTAEDLGVGFQIMDDVKNLTTGNPGKKRGDDIVEGKKSLPIILYLHKNPNRVEFVTRCFSAARARGTGVGEVEELIAELDAAGAIAAAKAQGKALVDGAVTAIRGSAFPRGAVSEEARELLAGLAEMMG
ncbi:MAG: polyprenyl synthetase family protein [Treponemataceae bacterium]